MAIGIPLGLMVRPAILFTFSMIIQPLLLFLFSNGGAGDSYTKTLVGISSAFYGASLLVAIVSMVQRRSFPWHTMKWGIGGAVAIQLIVYLQQISTAIIHLPQLLLQLSFIVVLLMIMLPPILQALMPWLASRKPVEPDEPVQSLEGKEEIAGEPEE